MGGRFRRACRGPACVRRSAHHRGVSTICQNRTLSHRPARMSLHMTSTCVRRPPRAVTQHDGACWVGAVRGGARRCAAGHATGVLAAAAPAAAAAGGGVACACQRRQACSKGRLLEVATHTLRAPRTRARPTAPTCACTRAHTRTHACAAVRCTSSLSKTKSPPRGRMRTMVGMVRASHTCAPRPPHSTPACEHPRASRPRHRIAGHVRTF